MQEARWDDRREPAERDRMEYGDQRNKTWDDRHQRQPQQEKNPVPQVSQVVAASGKWYVLSLHKAILICKCCEM